MPRGQIIEGCVCCKLMSELHSVNKAMPVKVFDVLFRFGFREDHSGYDVKGEWEVERE